ncbi:MAG: hypothetical protein KTR31_22590 [Myxococcales bacterium]|nr:hypothetical protein [Myxococcales bacterium]
MKDGGELVLVCPGWSRSRKAARGQAAELAAAVRSRLASRADPAAPTHIATLIWPTVAPQVREISSVTARMLPPAEFVDVAADLSLPQEEQLAALARGTSLTAAAARSLADVLAPLFGAGTSPEALVEAWRAQARAQHGTDDIVGLRALQLLALWRQRERARVLGQEAVGQLLCTLADGAGRIHLVGHSYGCNLLLWALARDEAADVASATLLQPAVGRRCFEGSAEPAVEPLAGALSRVRTPPLVTFSRRDVAMRQLFHWAVPPRLLGQEAAAPADGALGGWGPPVADAVVQMVPESQPYPDAPQGWLAVDATERIAHHADILSPDVQWAIEWTMARGSAA